MDNRKQKDYAYKQGDAGEDILVTVHLSTNELTTPKPLGLSFRTMAKIKSLTLTR